MKRLNLVFKKVITCLIILLFTWENAIGYALPTAPTPKNLGKVEFAPTAAAKNVILLLNAHTSSDAQKSIAELLGSFQAQGVDLIGLEGAGERIDGNAFRNFPVKDALEKAVWQFVKEGIFTGAEYFYITADKLPNFYGIEDKKLYLENKDAFVKTIKAGEALHPLLEAYRSAMKSEKASVYSKELLKLDQLIARHEENEISFLDYFLGLTNTAKPAQIALPNFPSVYALAKALEEEKQISLQGLRADLTSIRAKLSTPSPNPLPLLGGEDKSEGVDEHIFRMVAGEAGPPHSTDEIFENYQKIYSYFSKLIVSPSPNPLPLEGGEDKSEGVGINLKQYKHFSRYWNWLERISQVDPSKLFDELSALIDLLFERMAKTDREKQLVRSSHDFTAFQKLISIQLTQKEWKKINSPHPTLSPLWGERNKVRGDSALIGEAEASARRFYELAEKRNEVFAQNIIRNMETRKKNNSVVVLGGFHQEGLEDLLAKKGVSVQIVSPKIQKAFSDIPYLDRMMGKPSQLEDILEKDFSVSTISQALPIGDLISDDERNRTALGLRTLAFRFAGIQPPRSVILRRHRKGAASPSQRISEILRGVYPEMLRYRLPAGRQAQHDKRRAQNDSVSGLLHYARNDALVHFAFSSFTGLASAIRSEARIDLSKKDREVQIKIGTSGWRTTDKLGFTLNNVGRFAQAVAIVQSEDPELSKFPIAVGYDARPNARKYAVRAVEAIAGYWSRNKTGTRVDLIDQVTPTPVMGEATRANQPEGERYGITLHVTASHNPVYAKLKPREQWLGLKIFINGFPAPDSFTEKIVAVANDLEQSKSYRMIHYKNIPDTLTRHRVNLVERSAQRLRETFRFGEFKERITKADFRIAFNNMYGANAPLVKNIFGELKKLGIVCRLMNMAPMSKGKHPLVVKDDSGEKVMWAPNPTKPWFVGDERDVAKPGILLFRSDGDADRVVAHDIDGKTEINPNSLGLIFAHFLYHYRGEKGLILRSAPTTRGLDRFAEMNGLELKATGVGSKNFAPHADDLLVAVEESGHIFFKLNGQMFADHSLAAALLVMDIVATTGKSLSRYLDEIWQEIEANTRQNVCFITTKKCLRNL